MTPILLVVSGMGHVPSFKNNKLLTRGRLITNPRNQAWMEAVADAFASQLLCWFQTTGIEILTEQQALSSIATLVPLDDSLAWIGELSVNWRHVPKGMEGAEIVIGAL